MNSPNPALNHEQPRTDAGPDPGSLYDEAYYRSGCGPVPYERNDYWPAFFSGVADELARSLQPRKVLDAGCAMGFLVEALWARGVEAWGVDVSCYAISKVRKDIEPYCRVASLTEPVGGSYDLVTCIEVLEHLPPDQVRLAVKNLAAVTDRILFSSTPSDFDEPTHVSVRPPIFWLRLFAECDFQPDLLFDAGFLTPHAYLLRKCRPKLPEEALVLFSRMVLVRCVLAANHNQINSLRQHVADLNNQAETVRARARELEGVHDQNLMLRHQTDAVLQSMRTVEGERETARIQLRETQLHTVKLEQQLRDRIAEFQRQSEQFHESKLRVIELRQHIAQLRKSREDIDQLTRERNTLGDELRTVVESPAWKAIQHYRRWFNDHVNSRPWLKKAYEPIVWWFLRRFSRQHNRTASIQSEPPESTSPIRSSESVPSPNVAPLPVAHPAPVAPAPKVRPTYAQWIAGNEPDAVALDAQRTKARLLAYRPLISVVLPIYRVPIAMLRACITSVFDQTYDHWELCVAHAAPEEIEHRAVLTELAALDPRVKLTLLDNNRGISLNSNAALECASGDFVAFLDHDDTLAPFALYEAASLISSQPDLDVIYSDHDYIDEDGARRFDPLFKPEWSPEIMLSANYITHLTILRRSAVLDAGGFDPSTDGAQDWDLFLRILERTTRIAHIPQILYHWRCHSSSTALNTAAKDYAVAAQLRSIQSHLDRIGLRGRAEVGLSGLLHVHWTHSERRLVSIIIPSKDKVDLLSRTINSLRKLTAYDDYEILIIDNGSMDPATQRYYESLTNEPKLRVLSYPHPFNFSAMNNYGAKHAAGGLLLFLNNDMEITRPDWLDEMVGWAQVPFIGVTGAKLLRPDGNLQHAGVVIGFEGFAGHPFADQAPLTFGLYGSTGWYRNYLAVTGACMMLRREVFEEIGGFDEGFISCGSDVEICLRAWKRGYRTVYNPFAELIHYECRTRSGDVPKEDFLVSFRHYQPYLVNGDPYWSPNLSPWDRSIGFRSNREQSSLAFVQSFLKQLDSSATPSSPPLSSSQTEEDLFVSWFDHTPDDIRVSKELMASVRGYQRVRSIVWFIPPFGNAFYGGIFTILRFADTWARTEGVSNHFAICGAGDREQMAERIRRIHPACANASVTILADPRDFDRLPPADACVATLWMTAYYVLNFRTPRKFYFIQDYEPAFYRAGSASALAENTYRLGFYGIANTISLKEVYEREYGGTVAYFNPCVNLSVFHPMPETAGPARPNTWQLFCYTRPQHPRNAFELLMAGLRIVKSRLGNKVRIVCAGSEWDPKDYRLENVVENLGLLTYEETADLYRSCHAGVVFMLTRHPSYIPLELMASGCLVITNQSHWTAWLLHDGDNCLLSGLTASCLADVIERGLIDNALRQRIIESALALVRERYNDWEPEIAKIYRFICDPENRSTE